MDPKEFSDHYLQAFPQQSLALDEKEWSDFLSTERYYSSNSQLEHRLDNLSRSQLLNLIHSLNINEDHHSMTSSQLVSYVQNLRDLVNQQQIEITNFIESAHYKEKEFLIEVEGLKSHIEDTATQVKQLKEKIQQLQKELERKDTDLHSLYFSTPWKITAPMRAIVTQTRRTIHSARVLFYFIRQNVRLARQIWHAQGTRALLVRIGRKMARMAIARGAQS